MTAHLAVALAALFAAGLTLYSGFGLGTLLLPVFALFYPIEVAVGATAVVHGANNVFKVSMLGRYADRTVVVRFGLVAIISAILGASLLAFMAGTGTQVEWRLAGLEGSTTPLKLLIGALMLMFAVFELAPRFRALEFDRKYLPLGGFLSGFFGGLSGHQGALRSAFLVKTGLSTQAFVGTSSVIGLMVDMVRIMTYAGFMLMAGTVFTLPEDSATLVLSGIVAAFSGVLVGKRFLHKVTMGAVQTLTGGLLLIIAVLLGSGII